MRTSFVISRRLALTGLAASALGGCYSSVPDPSMSDKDKELMALGAEGRAESAL